MKAGLKYIAALLLLSTLSFQPSTCSAAAMLAFEGRITAVTTHGGQTSGLLYTVGTNDLRIERTETDRPYARDIVNLQSGEITLLFPNNRSFVRLKPPAANESAAPPGFPAMPAMPPGIGPQSQPQAAPAPPARIGPTNLADQPQMPAMPNMPSMPANPGMGSMPSMPTMPPPMMEQMELKPTGEKTNLLGFACEQYEIKQRGEVMKIWATDKLLPFQPYMQNQPHRFGPRMMEEQWGDLLKARKLFPLLAVLRFERPSLPGVGAPPAAGPERYRFEVKAITPEKITDETLFQPPPEYQEIQPLPF